MAHSAYGAVPQQPGDDDTRLPSSSPASESTAASASSASSAASSASPMTSFLSLAETAFTPLSLDSSGLLSASGLYLPARMSSAGGSERDNECEDGNQDEDEDEDEEEDSNEIMQLFPRGGDEKEKEKVETRSRTCRNSSDRERVWEKSIFSALAAGTSSQSRPSKRATDAGPRGSRGNGGNAFGYVPGYGGRLVGVSLSPASPEMNGRDNGFPPNSSRSRSRSRSSSRSSKRSGNPPAIPSLSTTATATNTASVSDAHTGLEQSVLRLLQRREQREGDLNNNNNNSNDTNNNTSTATATSTPAIVRPQFTRRPLPPPPPPPAETQASPTKTPPPPPDKPAIVRTTSSHGTLPLRHPAPDLNLRSGVYAGNIAQLEATAERLSMTSSIEDAIREAHQELKRSDSRRSSVLAASARQNSIVEINNAARTGGYSPIGYVMSPTNSLSGRLRSASKSSGTGPSSAVATAAATAAGGGLSDSVAPLDDGFPFMSRHGPGKTSVRSVRSISNKHPLPEIVEAELPMTLTQEALDEADRMMAAGEDPEDDDTIRASAHQHLDMDFDAGPDMDLGLSPNADAWAKQPMLQDHGSPSPQGYHYEPYQQLPTHDEHADYAPYRPEMAHQQSQPQRPTTAGSEETYEQAENAFGDFDGVHCDPDADPMANAQLPQPRQPTTALPEEEESQPLPGARPRLPAARPTSYFDPSTGQQMVYYPAPVPKMLQLPPKLARNSKVMERSKRRTQVLSVIPQEARKSRAWLPDPLEGEAGSPLMEEPQHKRMTSRASIPQLSPEILPPITSDPLSLGPGSHQGSVSENGTEAGPSGTQEQQQQQQPLDGQQAQAQPQGFRRPARLTDADKRKSRVSVMDGLAVAPQLRASAFFDLPTTTAQVEVKNGSAMDTLDSILDAAAAAPVSAFTDHAFAGKLGSEVYGPEKKRKKKKSVADAALLADPTAGSTAALGHKKRGSFLSLVGHMRKNSEPLDAGADRRTVIAVGGAGDPERQRLSGSIDGEGVSPGLRSEGGSAALAPDEDEGADEDEEEDEEEEEETGEVYQGPPTTLLAELQIRKQQQKMRTRMNQANGLHSTLLELDAVAEVERRARKGKKVNLAWEDPSMNPDAQDEDDDEDVPLGMLAVAKAAGGKDVKDISAIVAELHRPLGLMEKKALEDNEPLSRRRDRLQGRDPGLGLHLAPGLGGANNALKRQSMLTLTPTLAALGNSGAISPGDSSPRVVPPEEGGEGVEEEPAVEEVEGETLLERMRRLKAKEESELPRARPVSGAFSAELLGQFGDPAEDADAKGKGKGAKGQAAGKGKENAPPEEEETLGQRRRRLQAEKEARDREMMASGASTSSGGPAVNGQALHALTGGADRVVSRRLSMADVLGAHPLGGGQRVPSMDPREQERLRREEEAVRAARDREQKMAMMRAQMPRAMPTTGAGLTRAGGFMGGRFNDGLGGGIGMSALAVNDGPGVGHWAHGAGAGGPGVAPMGNGMANRAVSGVYGGMMQMQQQQPAYGAPGMGHNPRMSMMGGGYAPAGYAPAGYAPAGYGAMQMMPTQQGQVDMVERWRQSVQP